MVGSLYNLTGAFFCKCCYSFCYYISVIHPFVYIIECGWILPHVVPLLFSFKNCTGTNNQRHRCSSECSNTDTWLLGHVTIILFAGIVDISLFDCLGFEGRINTKDRFHPSRILWYVTQRQHSRSWCMHVFLVPETLNQSRICIISRLELCIYWKDVNTE
jgi:hypothetical protein